jgi:hypothetical protein
VSWTTGGSPDGGGWPPPGEPVSGRGLPDGAIVVFRIPLARCVLVTLMPVFLLLGYARVQSVGAPASRLLNPGTFAGTAVVVLALGLVFVPPSRRAQVAGGPGWVACRPWPLASWRVVQLSAVREYSVRTYATRGPRMTSLRMVDADGTHLTVAPPAGQRWLEQLVDGLAAQGAQQVDAGRLNGIGMGRAVLIVAVVLVVALVPLALLEAGPMRVLPDGVAKWFTSSGCRAALTVEMQGSGPAPSWGQTLQTGAETWHLIDHVTATVAQVAEHSADPTARLQRLTADGATGGYQMTYLGPDGSRIAVDAITFGSTAGAADYLHYVNRATCEPFSGTSGPAPGEVRWTSGKTYGFARWAGGTTIYDMSPVLGSPEATRTEVDDLAAAAQATASG